MAVPEVLYQTGNHAGRPAASSGCVLYSCTEHNLVYRSDGSSWTTWLTLSAGDLAAHLANATDAHDASAISFAPAGTIAATDVQAAIEEVASEAGGGGSSDNEAAASVLTDATSTGDAGSRADHFPGTSLDVAWVPEATALSSGPTVKYSNLTMVGPAGAAHHRLQAYTPSGAFRVEARMRLAGTGGGIGLLVRDSGTGDASGNGMMFDINTAGSNVVAYSLDTGSYNSRGTNGTLHWASGQFWIYLAIERNGSNAWTCQVSPDRVHWFNAVSGHSKTFTVAKFGFRHFNNLAAMVDFVDVVS
jgi:hypothetical protein